MLYNYLNAYNYCLKTLLNIDLGGSLWMLADLN